MRRSGVALALVGLVAWGTVLAATRSEAANQAVEMRGIAFVPDEVTVTAGESVTWTNRDNTVHTATSEDGTTFDSGTLATGFSYQHTFTEPGTFPYYCRYHPSMRARVVVRAAPQRSTTTAPTTVPRVTTPTTLPRATTTTAASTDSTRPPSTTVRNTTTTAGGPTTSLGATTTSVEPTTTTTTDDADELSAPTRRRGGGGETDVTGWAMVAGVMIALVALAAVLKLRSAIPE